MSHVMNIGLVVCCTAFVAAASPELVWEYRLESGHFDCSPAIGDLLQDGRPEIVAASTAGYVLALDASGNRIWQSDELGDFITVSPTLADVTGDGALEVFAVSNAGRLVCLDGRRGTLIWEYGLDAPLKWAGISIVAADLANNGRMNLVLGDTGGTLTCLDGDGRLVWRHKEPAAIVTSPAVGDLGGDGSLDILVGTRETALLCVSASGHVRWRLPDGDAAETSPVVWDITGDGRLEVITGIGNTLAAVDALGNVLWTQPMRGTIDSAISVADLTGDGAPEIIAVDLTGQVLCLGADGSVRWEGDVEQRARRSPAIADVTGNGTLEILIGGYSSAIHVFAASGELLERIDVGAHMNASPTILDLDGDGRLSVAAALNSARLRIYQWPMPAGAYASPWPAYRLNAARVASEFGIEADTEVRFVHVDFGRQYAGWNTVVAEALNPDGKSVTLRLEAAGLPEGVLEETHTSKDTQITAHLRYALDGQHAYNLAFSAILEREGRVLARRSRRIYVAPLQREWADIQYMLNTIEERLAALGDAERVEERLMLLRHRAGDMQSRVAQIAALPLDAQRQLRDDLHALLAQCRRWNALTREALRTDGPLAVHAANPWAPFGGVDELVEGRKGACALDVDAFAGSVESAALNLYNFASQTRTLRVEISDFRHADEHEKTVAARELVALHEVLETPTQMLDMAPDALPALNQAQTIAVPGWGARQLWLRIDSEPLDTPGVWQADLSLHPLAVGAAPVTVPLTLHVWEAAVPEKQALRLCTWAYVHRSPLADQPDTALEDQLSHGSSIFVSPFPPRAVFDEQGEIVSMDFSDHDAHVLKHGPHGILLQSGYTNAITGTEPVYSRTWRKAHIAYLRRWAAHMQDLGFHYDDYALYPRDEPGLTEGSVDFFMTFAELAKEADANIQVYANPVGGTTMEDLKRMAPYVDIWAPHRHAYMLGVGADKLDYIKSLGTTLWTYECEANVKHKSPLAYYRAYAWHAWQHGMTGIGFWTYCTSTDNPWHEPAPGNNDYMLVYPGDGVVTSKRWEAVRDAITDYSMLHALRTAVKQAEDRNMHEDAADEARVLLEERARKIAAFNGVWSDSHGPGAGGAPDERKRADEQWQAFREVRADIARLIAILKAE